MKTISTVVGRKFEIAVDSNPTAGYSWQAEVDKEKLRLSEHTVNPTGMTLGAAAQERFVFESLAPGDAVIRLVYKRPWEEKAQKIIAYEVRIAGS
jgi:predicted secreted protein